MRKLFTVETRAREELVDITEEVGSIVESSGIHSGIICPPETIPVINGRPSLSCW